MRILETQYPPRSSTLYKERDLKTQKPGQENNCRKEAGQVEEAVSGRISVLFRRVLALSATIDEITFIPRGLV